MAFTPKKKTLIYKRAKFATAVGPATLQSLIEAALKSLPSPASDRMENADGATHFRLINYHGAHGRKGIGGSMHGCEVFSFNKGANQGTLALQAGANELPVHSTQPGKDQEFVEGTAYFGVLGDHVIIIQSAALRLLELELHLNWLLREKTKVLDQKNSVSLDDVAPPEAVELKDVKGLVVSAPVQYETPSGDDWEAKSEKKALKSKKLTEAQRQERREVKIHPVGRAWNALKAFFGDEIELPPELPVEDLLRTGRMHVTLSLGWRNAPGEDAATFVETIAHRMRHVGDEFDYAVETKSGSITKDEFKLRIVKDVLWDDVRPKLDDVFVKMIEYLAELENAKRIKA